MRKHPLQQFLCCLLLSLAGIAMAVDEKELLEPDAAFQLITEVKTPNTLEFFWDIADGYYLYRDKIKWVSLTPGVDVEAISLPRGVPRLDPFFGDVEVYRDHLVIELPIRRHDPALSKLNLEVTYQGCADAGVCYLPIQKKITLDLSETAAAGYPGDFSSNNSPPFVSEQDRIAASLSGGSLGWIILSFLGFGLLLSFTPCVFPMIPVISGIIAGNGSGLSTRRAFTLSLCYVLASSMTYTVFGVLAGLFGNNLQIFFQQPWTIAVFSGIFVLLALSMFGQFQLHMPAYVQNKIIAFNSRLRRGSLTGTAVMGMLSALAIGPCVTAPLTGVLIYIGQSGDAVLGGLALFAMGIGMGIPLLIIGTSTKKLLPKTGPWMQFTNAIFGTGLLLVALWLLSRIMAPAFTLLLGGLLLMIPLKYLGWNRTRKAVGLTVLATAMLMVAGTVSRRQSDVMLLFCKAANACAEQPELAFKPVDTMDELQQILADAHVKGQWIMLDFYADWCVSCQELKHTTFADNEVQAALSKLALVQADVTKDNAPARMLLRHFDLIGPPAILFFGPDQSERKTYRIVGYVNSKQFLAQLQRMM